MKMHTQYVMMTGLKQTKWKTKIPDQAEDMREEASYNQALEFRGGFDMLTDEQKEAIIHYTKVDEDFAMEFNGWWGEAHD